MSQKKEFQLFLAGFNAGSKEKYTDLQAKNSFVVMTAFEAAQSGIYRASTSTRTQSLAQLDTGAIDTKVFECIFKNKLPITRAEIAKQTGIRLQTICGAVNRLSKSGRVFVAGKTFDQNSKRNVETLGVIYLTQTLNAMSKL